jgi:hypothetical protein
MILSASALSKYLAHGTGSKAKRHHSFSYFAVKNFRSPSIVAPCRNECGMSGAISTVVRTEHTGVSVI